MAEIVTGFSVPDTLFKARCAGRGPDRIGAGGLVTQWLDNTTVQTKEKEFLYHPENSLRWLLEGRFHLSTL